MAEPGAVTCQLMNRVEVAKDIPSCKNDKMTVHEVSNITVDVFTLGRKDSKNPLFAQLLRDKIADRTKGKTHSMMQRSNAMLSKTIAMAVAEAGRFA